MTRGIYGIRNDRTGKIYIGQSTQIERRFTTHRRLLNQHAHPNAALQESWIISGPEAFVFEILEEIAAGDLSEAEEKHIQEREAFRASSGFNEAHPSKKIRRRYINANRRQAAKQTRSKVSPRSPV